MNCKLLLLWVILSIDGFAQTNGLVTLEQCYGVALKNHPWSKQMDYYKNLQELNNKTILTSWLPTLTLNGQATWQSDVTKVDLQLPAQLASSMSIPTPNKDQYKATLDIRQTIYDGGLSKYRKIQESSDLQVNQQSVTVEMNKVKETINGLYFSYILNKEIKLQLDGYDAPLLERKKVLEAAVRNGIALPSDIDAIEAERLTIKQRISECELSKQSALKLLSIVTGDSSLLNISDLVSPSIAIVDSNTIKRAELTLFDLQSQKADASVGVLNSSRMPKLFAFSTLGYGNPGLNMFTPGWKNYEIVGVGFSWNVTDWGKTGRDKQTVSIQKSMIDTRRQDFVKNINLAMEGKKSEMLKMVSQIDNDEKLVELRSRITKVITKQVGQGTATNFDYINQLSKENDARIMLSLHRVQLQKLLADYKLIVEN